MVVGRGSEICSVLSPCHSIIHRNLHVPINFQTIDKGVAIFKKSLRIIGLETNNRFANFRGL